MAVRVRPDLAGSPGYVPGKSVPGAVKLASNESALGPLPSVVAAITAAASGINRYPDNTASALSARIAERFSVEPSQVVVGNGSVSLCLEVIQATCAAGQKVAFGWRSFEAYPVLARTAGAGTLPVPLTADQEIDLEALARAVADAGDEVGAVFLCTPNNPTGTTLSRGRIESFLDAVGDRVAVVFDEAYREFATDDSPDGTEFLTDADGNTRENVVVLRTFSKAYGLAGLRVGYAIGHPPLLNAVRAVHVPFSTNAIALAAADASLTAEGELRVRVDEVVRERSRVAERLRQLGYPVTPSQANFLWLPLGESTAEFDEFLQHHRVVVRAFPPDGVRVTVSIPEENEVFLRAAEAWAEHRRS